MTTQIFNKSKALQGPSQPEIHVAALGKHPAWDDFIDDPGLDTERLISIKRVLYLEGIAAAIETGSWDKLEPAQRMDGFGHLIVWRMRGEIVVARLWSSSDGKGRTKYPMAVVAHCKGVPLSWVLTEALPRLERLERRCREANTQEQIRTALDATRQELRSRAAVAELGAPIDPRAVATVADDMSASGSRDSLYRLMYQVERDWGAYLAKRAELASSTRQWSGGIRPQHARVPSGEGSIEDSLNRWMHFILNLVDSATTITLVRSCDQGTPGSAWTDVIVGEPEGSQFFCIRASDQSLPLATSIPYTIDEDFKRRCDRLVDESRAGQARTEGPEVVTASPGGMMDRLKGLLGGRKKGLLVLLIAGGLVGAGVGIAWYVSTSSSTDDPARTRAEAPREHPPPNDAAPDPKPQPAGAVVQATTGEASEWARLCNAYHDWFADFLQRLEKRPSVDAGVAAAFNTRAEYYATDPYLKALLDKLHASQAPGRAIDPWSIAGVPKSHDLAQLAKAPPPSIAQAETNARVDEAMRIVDGFSSRLPTDWPLVASLERAAGALEESGLRNEAMYLRSLVAGVAVDRTTTGGVPTDAGVDQLLAVSDVVTDLRAHLDVCVACAAAAQRTEDPVLKKFSGWLGAAVTSPAREEVNLAALQDLSRSLGRVADVAAPLGQFLQREWERTDVALVARRIAGTPGMTEDAPTRELFLKWLEIARVSPVVDASRDPRRSAELHELQRAVAALRERLTGEFKTPVDERWMTLDASTRASLESLASMPFNAETHGTIVAETERVDGRLRELRQGLENAVAAETVRRAGSAREVRAGLAAQHQIIAGSDAINAAWVRGRDALLESTSDAEYAQLGVSADELRKALLTLDHLVPRRSDTAGADALTRAISGAARSMREDSLRSAIEQWGGLKQDADGRLLHQAGEQAAARLSRDVGNLESFEQDVRVLMTRAAAGASLAERSETGEPIASVVERIRRAEYLKNAAIAAVVSPFLSEIGELEKLEALVGANELLAAAEAALPERWMIAMAAWRRLGRLASPSWPESLASLQREAALSTKLLAAVASSAGPRRAELEQEVRRQRAARWATAFAAISDPAHLETAAAMAGDMGVDAERLEPSVRYNLELATLRRAAAGGGLNDEQVRRRVQHFETTTAAAGESVTILPGVQQLRRRLDAIVGDPSVEPPAVAVTALGPGSATGGLSGFVGVVEGSVVRFTNAGAKGGPLTLEFCRVDPPAGETFFVSTSEVSLGQFIAIVETGNGWKELSTLFPSASSSDDFRKGPRVWRWSDGGTRGGVATMRPAERWLREVATGRNVAESPAGVNAGSPGLTHPMNYVPPSAALFVAQLGGCRLPTVAEWAAAVALTEGAKDLQKHNLRDQQWKRQQTYISSLARTGSVNWPDDDIFLPAGSGPRLPTGPTAPAHPWDDGVLWFAPVTGSDPSAPAAMHLIGNVAEFVMDVGAGELVPPPSGPSGAGAKAILARHRERLRIGGGSAMSPIGISPPEAFAADFDEAVGGYADVGFRLAFSAVGVGPVVEPLGVQLAKAVTEASYIIKPAGK